MNKEKRKVLEKELLSASEMVFSKHEFTLKGKGIKVLKEQIRALVKKCAKTLKTKTPKKKPVVKKASKSVKRKRVSAAKSKK